MNLSETVFFLRPIAPGADYRVRFFTPRHELPFAGHPTIASAHAFVERYGGGKKFENRLLRQECKAGIIPIEVRQEKIGRIYVMQQRWPQYRDMVKPRDYYARLLGCAKEDLANSPVQVVSTAVPWLIVHLVNEDILNGLAPNFIEMVRECRDQHAVGITVFSFSANGSSGVAHLRAFAPGEGVMKNPVCGSGNGAVGAYVALIYYLVSLIFIMIRAGQHITTAGADDDTKCELEADLLKDVDTLIVDSIERNQRYGDVHLAIKDGVLTVSDISGELGQFFAGQLAAGEDPYEITAVKLVGLGVQDPVTIEHALTLFQNRVGNAA